MAQHKAFIHWQFAGGDFRKGRYSRVHTWRFDGGLEVPASPSPHVVPAPWSEAAAVDPEEAYVASLASCHMMTFLFLAARAGFEVMSYDDEAVGTMLKNEQGRWWVNEVVLRPRIVYGGDKGAPDAEESARLHHAAHEECFIANSVKTHITVATPD
jgi:organic hydroperoxide reductase OsmC/OhrA